jgi:hypothetical protein
MTLPLLKNEEDNEHPKAAALPHWGRCHLCGGKLGVLVRVAPETNGPPVIYYACERCAQVLVRKQ